MLIQDSHIKTALISQFNGAVNADTDSYSVDPSHGLYARNVRYGKGLAGMDQVGTRLGYSQVAQIGSGDGRANSLTNWYFVYGGAQLSIALYYGGSTGIRGWRQATSTLYSPFITFIGAEGVVIVTAGQRFYAAYYDSTGRLSPGGGQGMVYGWNIGSDNLFAQPLSTIGVPSLGGAGVVTAGQHGIAYLTTTRNGYTGRLQAVDSSGNFTPVFFGTTGTNAITFTLTLGALPSYLSGGTSAIQVVMTTATNGNRWFAVPGAIIHNPIVGANTATINITDDDLTATGTDVTQYLNLLTTIGGVPPFYPSAIFTYSSRMGYVTVDAAGFPVIYISDPNNYQKLTADQNAIYLDGVEKPVQGVSLHSGTLFIATLDGFFQTSDNGDVPVTWTPPFRVDGSVGIQSPTCLLVNSKSGYILVASTQGLYLFQGGIFPELPISYYQNTDWQRINWAIPTQVQVAEDGLNRVFHVMAPLTCQISNVTNASPAVVTTTVPHLFQTGLSVTIAGTGTSVDGVRTVTVLSPTTFSAGVASGGTSATGSAAPNAANAEMTWDYTDGFSPQQAQYSLRAFSAYRMGGIGNVFNTTNGLNELWFSPAVGGPGCLIRQNIATDPHPYSDVDMSGSLAAIDSSYQTSNLPGAQDETSSTLHDYAGAHLRLNGNGNCSMLALGLDGNITVTPAASPISMLPQEGKELLLKWFLRSEQQTLQFGTNAIDSNFILSLIRAYYVPSLPQR